MSTIWSAGVVEEMKLMNKPNIILLFSDQHAQRIAGRIDEVLQRHHFRSGEEPYATLRRDFLPYNRQLPQSALGSKAPLQVMKDRHNLKPKMFKK